MSSRVPSGEIRNPFAAVDELYTDISRVEAGESPDEIAESWLDVEEFMGLNRGTQRPGLVRAVLKALGRKRHE